MPPPAGAALVAEGLASIAFEREPADFGEPAAHDFDSARTPTGGRPRLLLIDDEPSVARFLAHAAEENGFEAKITISAETFRRAYEDEDPDVILVDLAMPGADGIELLRFLAERKSEAVVLIVSGFDSRVLEAAMRLGEALGLRMAGPLTKPMRVSDMIDAIRSARPRAVS
ncbi:MAG: hypothetical protein JWO25_1709 [Alphaproteobacteria bacterium]|nr:hypothetical protein [Alphaproteobacteria bacterium]